MMSTPDLSLKHWSNLDDMNEGRCNYLCNLLAPKSVLYSNKAGYGGEIAIAIKTGKKSKSTTTINLLPSIYFFGVVNAPPKIAEDCLSDSG